MTKATIIDALSTNASGLSKREVAGGSSRWCSRR